LTKISLMTHIHSQVLLTTKIYYREDYTSPTLARLFPFYQDILIWRDFIYRSKDDRALISTKNIEYHSLFESMDFPSGLVSLLHDNKLNTTFCHLNNIYDVRKENKVPQVYIVDRWKALELLEKYECRLRKIEEEVYCTIPPLCYLVD